MDHQYYDAIVIGAGHNGLTTANYLAMGGLSVCVLEQRDVIGGAAVSEEFHPGFRNSIASYVVSLLRPEVVDELELKKYGYEPILLQNSFYPDSKGDYLLLTDDDDHNRRQYEKFSSTDYQALSQYYEFVEQTGEIISSQWLKEPPKLSVSGLSDMISSAKLGLDVLKLNEESRHRMLQFLIGAPVTIIDRWFESEKIKAMVAASCTPANYASLHQPGAAMAMLHHAVGEVDGEKGGWGLVKGGMGTITQAMGKSAEAKGVVIRTGVPVGKIIVENGVASGVQLESGETLFAKTIAANTDPNRTFLKLLGEEHLPTGFAKDIGAIRQESASLRMNLALSGLPEFACIPGKELGPHHKASIMFIESKDHVETAYNAARSGRPADPPFIDALIPSTIDDTLTDEPGTHVMSLLCKYMPYDLEDGKSWDNEKERVTENVLNYLSTMIPNLRDILVATQCLTPLDLERMFGMTRGDICHGRLEPDQLFSARPHPDAAQYGTPVKNLYLCGSGAHPGGGVTGAPGRNAAKRILKDWKRLRTNTMGRAS
ncbi:MAG: NAD(P)/FAD-dependent oxidoreductase [Pseudomonadota bacterium]